MYNVPVPTLPNHLRNSFATNSRPSSERICSGNPLSNITSARASITSYLPSLLTTRISSGGGASPNVTVAQVPNGIYVRLDGGFYWAIGGVPNLIAADYDKDNVVTQWKLEVPMYCGPGGNGQGCNMKVDVWAKRKP